MTADPTDAFGAEARAAVEIDGALARLRRTTGLPVAFGGLVEQGRRQVRISRLSGTATPALSSLAVISGSGLGGRAVALARPCAVTDYSTSRRISHEYDEPVAAEGLRAIVAVPVVVRRRVRGVVYGALRSAQLLGDRTLGLAVEAARDVEQALVVREEVDELLAAARPALDRGRDRNRGRDAAAGVSGAMREQVREAHAALRALAPRIDDPVLRAELLGACALLTGDPGGTGGTNPAGGTGGLLGGGVPRPAPREVDVLVWVAAGATNAVAAERLGVTAGTVKAYLRSAMRKLGARTRGEAVVSARRAGWLP